MHMSVVLRAVALLCLGTVFRDSVVTAQQATTCPEPTTLKDILDLLGKLGNTADLKEKVSKQVEDSVQTYLKTTDISGKSVKQNIEELFKKVPELRQSLLKTPTEYGKYAGVTVSDANTSATVLINWLPILHSEMWYLYFETATECKRFGGDWWTTQWFKGTDDKKQLTKWLTLQEPGIPVIPKGFSNNDFKDQRDPNMASKTGIKLHQGDHLNHAQYGLFFLSSTWHHSNLASAVLFLQEFCSEVSKEGGMFKEKLSGDKNKGLKSACAALSTGLASLTEHLWPLYSPLSETQDDGEDDGKKEEERKKHKDARNKVYEGKLKSESFDKYIDWLKKSLVGINDSIKEMAKSSWSIDELFNATMAGPFKYGFVFKDVWGEADLYLKLNDVATTLNGNLNSLATALGCPMPQPAPPSPSERQGARSTSGPQPTAKPTSKPDDGAKNRGPTPSKQTDGPLKPAASEVSSPAKPRKPSPADPKAPEAQLRSEEDSQPSSFMATSLLSCMLTCVMMSVF